jgi:dihydroorotate dehydrogenase electron transfer subunit
MKLEILKNTPLCGSVFRMHVNRGGMKTAVPGQFVHVRCSESFDPLLRRPFSISNMEENSFEIIYKVAGRGTNLLSDKKKGELLDVMGPLGNGFPLPSKSESAVIIAGGMGIAPTLFLAKIISNSVSKFILGAKTRGLLLCSEEFGALGINLVTATEDGTCGIKGDVCSALSSTFQKSHPSVIYACGPAGMLKEVYNISKTHNIRCFLSFENLMACGVGACLGCVIKTFENGIPSYKRVCRDGPVFNGDIIEWESLTSV